MKPRLREIDHVVLRAIIAHLRSHGVAPGEAKTRYGAEGNQVELKGPSDGQGPPS